MPGNTSPKRRPSHAVKRRSKILPSLPSKTRPGLALDTSVSRHKAPAPQQVFPESKTQELSFISLADIKALKKQRSVNKQRQKQLERAQPPAAQRSYSNDVVQQDLPPPYTRSKPSDDSQAVHKRVKGLRPTPLDLSTDISPSDRAITIGISVDPKTASHHSRTPSSPVAGQTYPVNQPRRRPSEKHNGQDAVTPTIVITPAKEDFDFDLGERTSSDLTHETKTHRPASSIYSRYTNCMPANGYTPPVPPLPLFAVCKNGRVHESDATGSREEALKVPKRGREKNLSVCTVFEEDQPPPTTTQTAKRLTSQSHLPTPRRSRGWWNLITSPFSAGSKSNAFFWKSSPQEEDEDQARMLDDSSEMPSNAHAGLIFSNRSVEDLDLRSAPPTDSRRNSFGKSKPRQPLRSDTAPGALDPSGKDGVNIYTIPWVGAAADYYNPHKNFPSIMFSPEALGDRGLDGWSPSQSAYREPRESVKGVVAHIDDDGGDSDSSFIDDDNPFEDDPKEGARGLDDEKSPFSDAHASNTFVDFSGTHPAANADKKFFSTPETEELRGASPEQPPRPSGPTRNETLESRFSPLTATPVIEDARMGTLINPSVVDIRTPARTDTPPPPPPPPAGAGIGAVTMSSRGLDDDATGRERSIMDEKAPFRPIYGHQRNDSYGLGIDTRSNTDAGSEKELFPPPKPLAQQPRLGTDKFGQLRIEEHSDREEDWSPWWQRFMWPLAGLVGGALLLLLVVLLAVFVVQGHKDMGVQVQWVALAGFPALPTGVAAVVGASNQGQEGGCVKPEGLWSCGVPAQMGEGKSGNGGEETTPNFRFEIRFRNKTRDDFNKTDLLPTTTSIGPHKRSISRPSFAHAKLHKRSAWSDSLYASLPAPPSDEDMIFLGNTTDGVSEPFEGEDTPFYLTLLNATALEEAGGKDEKMKLRKREKGDGVYPYPTDSGSSNDGDQHANSDSSSGTHSSNSTSASTTLDDSADKSSAPSQIPRPYLTTSGHPAAAQLYPLAQSQPLRLFNRGEKDEHYGFYTYYDRSVYIRTSGSGNGTTTGEDRTLGEDEVVANTRLEESNAVCVFSQTRMHVQIWTQRGTLPGMAALNETVPSATEAGIIAANSTANDMTAPGSFPYPMTITLDRHGGDAEKKGVYCYGLDSEGRVMRQAKSWIVEDRGFGGKLVDAAPVPGGDAEDGSQHSKRSDGGGKGIDGGDGGCSCSWGSGSGNGGGR